MLGMIGDIGLRGRISSERCFSFNGTRFVKTDWNWPFKLFALSEAFVYVTPFDFKEVISLLSDFCCLIISVQKRFGAWPVDFWLVSYNNY